MTNPTPDLLPCPFCGGDASLKTRSLDERFGYAEESEAACKKCGIGYSFQDAQNPKGGYALGGTGAPRAIAAWNARILAAIPQGEK